MYFYLKWKDRRPSEINLLKDRPKEINFENKFKIKSVEYIICGYINPKFQQYYPPLKLQFNKTNYLLSHLQKAIRRMDDIKSVKSAKHLIDLDYTSFIRRLPIIMLEDTTIHESFPILIWLMIASSKGFPMKKEINKWLLGVVYHLSKCNYITAYSSGDIEEIEINGDDLIPQSLRFRKAYGGMKGDMNMIEYYTHLLINKKIKINNDKIGIIKIEMDSLHRREWIIEANDFHCNRYIINYISKHFPKLDKVYIKELIWIFSSSQNNRVCVDKDQKKEKDWDKISKLVNTYQKNCIFY